MSIRICSFQQGLEILNSAKIRCEACGWFVLLGWEMKEEPDSRVVEGRVRCKCGCGDSEIAVCVDVRCRDFTNIIQNLSGRIAGRDFSPFRTWSDGMVRLDEPRKIEGNALIDYVKKSKYRIDPALWMADELDAFGSGVEKYIKPERLPDGSPNSAYPKALPYNMASNVNYDEPTHNGVKISELRAAIEGVRRRNALRDVMAFADSKLGEPWGPKAGTAAPAPPPPKKPAPVKEAPRAITWEE